MVVSSYRKLACVQRNKALRPAISVIRGGANLLVLNPALSEKSLIIATRLLKFDGSTAMCSSASGTVDVGVIVGPTVYGDPEKIVGAAGIPSRTGRAPRMPAIAAP